MSHTIKTIFDDECRDLVVDAGLVKKINLFNLNFVNRNEESIKFFGGNLLGVEVVRFRDADRDRWFEEIIQGYESSIKERLFALPTIFPDRKIASSPFNNSCAWLAHRVFNSDQLDKKQKHEALVDIFLILQYKYLTSILYNSFKYPANRATAEATYAQLSYKYAIKVYGSWMALLRARAEEIVSPTGIHYNTIVKMDDDVKVGYLLNDIQNRLRDMIKNIYAVFATIHAKGIRVTSTSSVVEYDGESMLKDKTKSLLTYERYINSVISDKNSFIREELLAIIEKIMHTAPPRLFRETLEWMSNNYKQSNSTLIEDVLNEIIIHSFDYVSHNRALVHSTANISELLSRLRGVYMSSRSTDPALLSLRKKMEDIVRQATNNKNDSIIASVRTATMLYIILRSYTMHHYS